MTTDGNQAVTLILGIETSCDETAASVVENGRVVRSNVVASQDALHERYGGVVPEIASRAHIERIGPVIDDALRIAGVEFNQLDAIAVGNRPGLIGSLLVGVSAAKAMAWSAGKPLIGIDHVRAHLYAASLLDGSGSPVTLRENAPNEPETQYPALGLVVSGGHTSLYELDAPTELRLIGRTIDDAVGEAYDKAAVILQLGYPGGPKLDLLAQTGDANAYKLPRSLLNKQSLDFSFSGLKTALLYTVRGYPKRRGDESYFEKSADELTDRQRRDMAASFQAAAIDALIIKLRRAHDQMAGGGRKPESLIIGGGVSANSLLRQRVVELGGELGLCVHLPRMAYCLDNAAMIAGLADHEFRLGHFDDLSLPAVATISS